MTEMSNHHCIYSDFDLIAYYEGEAEVEEFLKFQVLAGQDTRRRTMARIAVFVCPNNFSFSWLL